MYLTLYISSKCKSPIIYDFEFFLRVRSQSQIWWYFRRVRCQRLRGPEWSFFPADACGLEEPTYLVLPDALKDLFGQEQ